MGKLKGGGNELFEYRNASRGVELKSRRAGQLGVPR